MVTSKNVGIHNGMPLTMPTSFNEKKKEKIFYSQAKVNIVIVLDTGINKPQLHLTTVYTVTHPAVSLVISKSSKLDMFKLYSKYGKELRCSII